MPWSVAAAAVTGAAGLGAAAMQSGNAGKAAGQSTKNLQMMLPQMQQNYNAAVDAYRGNYTTAVGAYAPYVDAGTSSLKAEQDLMGLNGPDAAAAAMANFQQSPGYQWQLQQGLRAVDAGAAAKGMLRSGATLKGEETYGQGLADQDFGNYFTRLNGLLGQGQFGVTGIANAGNVQAAGLSGAGANLINGMTGNVSQQNQILTNAANAQNSILGNAATGFGNTANSLLNNKNFQDWINGTGSTPTPNTSFSGYAPAMQPGQAGTGGFVAPTSTYNAYTVAPGVSNTF